MHIPFEIIAPQDSSNDNSMNISSTLSNMLQSLAAIDRVQLKLRSFEVEDAMETRSSLAYLIGIQLRSDIRDHFAQLFGSLALIGSPVGFARLASLLLDFSRIFIYFDFSTIEKSAEALKHSSMNHIKGSCILLKSLCWVLERVHRVSCLV